MAPESEESLYLAHLAGGMTEPLTHVDTANGEAIHTWPARAAKPRSSKSVTKTRTLQSPAAVRLSDRRVQRLGLTGHNPRFAGGFLLFGGDEDVVFAAPFDPVSPRLTGPPKRVLDGVTVKQGPATELAIAENGTLLYVSPSRARKLFALDRHGRQTPLHLAADAYSGPRVSPDGKRLAVAITKESGRNVWVGDLAGASAHPGHARRGERRSRVDRLRTLLLVTHGQSRQPTWWQTSTGTQPFVGRQATVVMSPTMTFAIGAGAWQSGGKRHGNSMIEQIALDSAGRPTSTVTLIRGSHPKISPGREMARVRGDHPGIRDVFSSGASPLLSTCIGFQPMVELSRRGERTAAI